MTCFALNRKEGFYALFMYGKLSELKFKDGDKEDYVTENLTFPEFISTIADLSKLIFKGSLTYNKGEHKGVFFEYSIDDKRISKEHQDDLELVVVHKLTHYISEFLRSSQDMENKL